MLADLPLVSIVIPHFARPALLCAAVKSVMASTEQQFEIIIVDDGSSTEDWRAVQVLADERTKVLQRADGIRGPSRCRNLGLAEAKGKYVIFLDSDDLLAPWCIEKRLSQAGQAPEADFWVFPVLLFRESPGDMDQLWNALTGERDPAERFVRSDPPWHTSSPLWKRQPLQRIGGFNEAVFYGDDSDLHLRALIGGLELRLYPDVLPDAFVRRSNAPRITNSLSSDLIESRRIRLREGTRFLRSNESGARHLPAWEGQYFVEAEFLLFNHTQCRVPIRQVIGDWVREFSPGIVRWFIVQAYYAVALSCKPHAYLALRIARRIAMKLLPGDFFPRGETCHAAVVKPSVMTELGSHLI